MARIKETKYDLTKPFRVTDISGKPDDEKVYGQEAADALVTWPLLNGTEEDRAPRGTLSDFRNDGPTAATFKESQLVPPHGVSLWHIETVAISTNPRWADVGPAMAFGGPVPGIPTDRPFSISLWYYPKTTGPLSQGYLVRVDNKTIPFVSGLGVGIQISTPGLDGDIQFSLGQQGGATPFGNAQQGIEADESNFPAGIWHHIVCTYDGRGTDEAYKGMKIYVNGIEVVVNSSHADANYIGHNVTEGSQISIGVAWSPNQWNWDVRVGDVASWDKELTPSEIAAVHHASSARWNTVRYEVQSGFLNNPPRTIIRALDAATGSYPSILRTNPGGRSGDHKISFDDTNTVNFESPFSTAWIDFDRRPHDAATIKLYDPTGPMRVMPPTPSIYNRAFNVHTTGTPNDNASEDMVYERLDFLGAFYTPTFHVNGTAPNEVSYYNKVQAPTPAPDGTTRYFEGVLVDNQLHWNQSPGSVEFNFQHSGGNGNELEDLSPGYQGILINPQGSTGYIDYETGEYSLSFVPGDTPANGTVIKANHRNIAFGMNPESGTEDAPDNDGALVLGGFDVWKIPFTGIVGGTGPYTVQYDLKFEQYAEILPDGTMTPSKFSWARHVSHPGPSGLVWFSGFGATAYYDGPFIQTMNLDGTAEQLACDDDPADNDLTGLLIRWPEEVASATSANGGLDMFDTAGTSSAAAWSLNAIGPGTFLYRQASVGFGYTAGSFWPEGLLLDDGETYYSWGFTGIDFRYVDFFHFNDMVQDLQPDGIENFFEDELIANGQQKPGSIEFGFTTGGNPGDPLSDDSNGILGPNSAGSAGTIDYATGDFSLTFDASDIPDNATAITATHTVQYKTPHFQHYEHDVDNPFSPDINWGGPDGNGNTGPYFTPDTGIRWYVDSPATGFSINDIEPSWQSLSRYGKWTGNLNQIQVKPASSTTFEFQRGVLSTPGNVVVDIHGTKTSTELVAKRFTKAVNDSDINIKAGYKKNRVTLRQHTPGPAGDFPIEVDLRRKAKTPAIRVQNQGAHPTKKSTHLTGSLIGGSEHVTRYPTLLHALDSGTEGRDDPLARWSKHHIATPHMPSDLIAPGITVKGVADYGLSFTPGEEMGPFHDERVNIDNDDEFFDEGTPNTEIEGFSNPLRSKTQIVIDMPVVEPTTIGYDGNTFGITGAGNRFHNMAYYSPARSRWEHIGRGLNIDGSGYASDKDYHNAFFEDACVGFSRGIELLSDGPSMASLPISNFGFPMHHKFAASATQTISMSDYITQPFILEKYTLELDMAWSEGTEWNKRACMYASGSRGIKRRSDKNVYNNKAAIQNFFLLNQRPWSGELEYDTEVFDVRGTSTWNDGDILQLSVPRLHDSFDLNHYFFDKNDHSYLSPHHLLAWVEMTPDVSPTDKAIVEGPNNIDVGYAGAPSTQYRTMRIGNEQYPAFRTTQTEYLVIDSPNLGQLDFTTVPDGSPGTTTSDLAFSVSMWIALEDNSQDHQCIFHKDNNGGGYQAYLRYPTNPSANGCRIEFQIQTGPADIRKVRAELRTVFPIGTPLHLVCTYAGRGGDAAEHGLIVYLNGKKVENSLTTSAGTYTGMEAAYSDPLQVGKKSGSIEHFRGDIAEFAIWKTRLSAGEAEALYNSYLYNVAPTQYSRDLITYGQVTTYAGVNNADKDIFQVLDDGLGREVTVEATNSSGNPHDGSASTTMHTTGSFMLQGTCKTPIPHTDGSAYVVGAKYASHASGQIFFQTSHPGTRSGIPNELKSPRGLSTTIPGSKYMGTIGELSDGGGTAALNVYEPIQENSPYILLPGDKLVLGCQIGQPYWAARSADGYPGGTNATGPHLTLGASASADNVIPYKLTLYGSLIRDNKEYHDPLNQPLTSDALHEALHYDNPTVDQFDTDTMQNLASTTRDELCGGDIFSYGPYPSTQAFVFQGYENETGFSPNDTRNCLYIEPHLGGVGPDGTDTISSKTAVGDFSHPTYLFDANILANGTTGGDILTPPVGITAGWPVGPEHGASGLDYNGWMSNWVSDPNGLVGGTGSTIEMHDVRYGDTPGTPPGGNTGVLSNLANTQFQNSLRVLVFSGARPDGPRYMAYTKPLTTSVKIIITYTRGEDGWYFNEVGGDAPTSVGPNENPESDEVLSIQYTTQDPTDEFSTWTTLEEISYLSHGAHPFETEAITVVQPANKYYLRIAQLDHSGLRPTGVPYDTYVFAGIEIQASAKACNSSREFWHGDSGITGATGLFSGRLAGEEWVIPIQPIMNAWLNAAGQPEGAVGLQFLDETRIEASGGGGSPECGPCPGVDIGNNGQFDISAAEGVDEIGHITSINAAIRGGQVNYRTGDMEIRYDSVLQGQRDRVTVDEDYSELEEIGTIEGSYIGFGASGGTSGYYMDDFLDCSGATNSPVGPAFHRSAPSWPNNSGDEPSKDSYSGDFAVFAIKFTAGEGAPDTTYGLGPPTPFSSIGATARDGLSGDWIHEGSNPYPRPIKAIHDYDCTKETTLWSVPGSTAAPAGPGTIRFGKDSGGWPVLWVYNPFSAPDGSYISSGGPGFDSNSTHDAFGRPFIITLTDDFIEPDTMIPRDIDYTSCGTYGEWGFDGGAANQFYSSTWSCLHNGNLNIMPNLGHYGIPSSVEGDPNVIFVPIGACIDPAQWENNIAQYSAERQARAMYNAVISYNNTMVRGIPQLDEECESYVRIREAGYPSPADPCAEMGYDSAGTEHAGGTCSSAFPGGPTTTDFIVYDGRDTSTGEQAITFTQAQGRSQNWGINCFGICSAWSLTHPSQVFCYDVTIVEDEFGVKNTVVFESWYGGTRSNLPIIFLSSTLSSMFKDRIGSRDIGDPNNSDLPGESNIRLPSPSELWEAEPWEYLKVTASSYSVNADDSAQCLEGWPNGGIFFTSYEETSFLAAASIGGRDPYAVTNTADFDVIDSGVTCASYLDIHVKPSNDPEANWPDGQAFNEDFKFRIYFNDHSNNYMSYINDPDHPGGPSADPISATGGIVYADTSGLDDIDANFDGGVYVIRHDKNLDDSSVSGFSRMKDDTPLNPGDFTSAITRIMQNPKTRIRIGGTPAAPWTGYGIPSGWARLYQIPAWKRLRFEAVGGKLRIQDLAANTELSVVASDNSILRRLIETDIEKPGDQYVQGNLYHEHTRQVAARFTQAGSLPWTGLPMPGPGTQGSFYRNLRISSDTDRYYDSMVAAPTTYHELRGKDLAEFYGTHMIVGQPNPADGGVPSPEKTMIRCGPENMELENHSLLEDGLTTSIEGCWFTIYDSSNIAHNVWYDIDGRGDIGYPPIAPSEPSGVLIKVEDINIGAGGSEVAQKTAAALAAYPQFITEYETGQDYFFITNTGNGIATDASFPGVEGVQDPNTGIVIGGAPGGAGASDGGGQNTDGGAEVNNSSSDARDWYIEVEYQGTDSYPERIASAVDDSWLAAFPFEHKQGLLQREIFVRDTKDWSVVDTQDILSDLAPAGTFGSSQSEKTFSTLMVTGSIFGYGPNPGTNMSDPWADYGSNTRYFGAQGFISDEDGNIYFEKSQTVRDNVYRFYFGSGRGWAHSPILSQSARWRYIPQIRGWKYGLISAMPLNSSMIFRSDKYGQFRDLMEQRPDTRYFTVQGKKTKRQLTSSTVRCRFLDPDGDATDPALTWSQNLSPYCTSSLPFFDDNTVRNREPIDPSQLNTSAVLVG